MDLKLDEQLLLADFRRLDPEGKKALLAHATALVKKQRSAAGEEGSSSESQCSIEPEPEVRPEAAKEPIFTE